MSTPAALPLTISEADFQRTVINLAVLSGWLVCHFRSAPTGSERQGRTRRWSTPIQGHVGLPDLVLARDGVVLLAELKRHGGRPTPQQRGWLAALGDTGRLWGPSDWPEVVATLTAKRERVAS